MMIDIEPVNKVREPQLRKPTYAQIKRNDVSLSTSVPQKSIAFQSPCANNTGLK